MTPLKEETVIDQKLQKLAGLVEQREQLQARITRTENAIRAFIELLENEISQKVYTAKLSMASKPMGLTEVVKYELRKARKLTPAMLKDRLKESGFPLSGYANPFAVLYTTLTRLEDQKLIKKVENGEYEWIAVDDINTARDRFLDAHRKGIERSVKEKRKKD
jgi:hypothetical protein